MRIRAAAIAAILALRALRAQDISPLLYGQNHWLASGDENRTGYLHLLWPKVKECGVTVVRIGGNAYEKDPPSLMHWVAMVDSVEAIGAEPIVQVPRQYTAEQTTALVDWLDRICDRPVRYWSIGNEPTLHNDLRVDEVYAYIMGIAPAIRSADPGAKILVPDDAWMRPEMYGPLCGGRLDVTGKDARGRWLVDGFTFHSYPNGAKFNRTDVTGTGVAKIRSMIQDLVALLEKADKMHGREREHRLSWGLTEVNVTYVNPDRNIEGVGNPSFVGGQFIAEVFGLGMEYGALTITPWAISETDNPQTDFGFLGLPPDFAPRSSYYHEQMLAQNFRGSYLPATTNQPLVKAFGSKSAKRICVILLNEEEHHGFSFDIALSQKVNSAKPLVVIADAGIGRVISDSIAPQSTQLFVFDGSGKLVRKETYSLLDNLRFQPPQVQTFR